MKTVMCLLLWIAFLCVMGAGLLTPASAQTAHVWTYTCYKTPDAVANFLSTIPYLKAERAKAFVLSTASSYLDAPYCIYYEK